MSTLKSLLLLLAVILAVVLGACDSTLTEPKDEKAPATICETGPYLIHLSGQCRVASSRRIVCEDETTTTPRDKVLNVIFQLRNADTGAPLETRSLNPGTLPREISFSGLPDGPYEIRHTVQARDCTATFTTYANLEVF
jgi:hypothetical protein